MIYSVPVVYTYAFGADIEVEAGSIEEAEQLVLNNTASADGLDWSRAYLQETRIGSWKPTTQV